MTELVAIAVTRDDGTIELRSPSVGIWHGPPARGSLVRERHAVGQLELLGQRAPLISPATGLAIAVAAGPTAARGVSYGELLAVLSPDVGAIGEHGAGAGGGERGRAEAGAGQLAFRSPSSGRYYGRPGPGKPAFVQVGDEIATGDTVCLLEVMKTFNRVVYGGVGLPERARVAAIRPNDGDDLVDDSVILELQSLPTV